MTGAVAKKESGENAFLRMRKFSRNRHGVRRVHPEEDRVLEIECTDQPLLLAQIVPRRILLKRPARRRRVERAALCKKEREEEYHPRLHLIDEACTRVHMLDGIWQEVRGK